MPRAIPSLRVSAYTAVSAVGDGRAALLDALRARRSGLSPNDFGATPLPTWIGRVPSLEDDALPVALAAWECRNNRLAWRGLLADAFIDSALAARERYGADRIALVLGTSTSSIGASEEAYATLNADGQFPLALRRPIVHTPHSLGDFVAHALDLRGPCVTVATACSSSAKVFAQAERMIRAGVADAAIVGGVDTLCGSVLFGFNSLALVATDPCRPFDRARAGISLGEAAGFALLERGPGAGPWLRGYGESSDAHHMSSPHPEGIGARRAIADALARGALSADEIDYINLHGTASQKNDEVEARVVADLFPARTHAASSKGFTGHTLGAAGIVEATIAMLALETGLMPGNLNAEALDEACGPQIRIANGDADVRVVLSHSFGFGGSNAVLAFAREARA